MQFLVETVCVNAPAGTFPCKPPRWLSFYYYQAEVDSESECVAAQDSTLGQLIERLVHGRDSPCEAPTCKKLGKEHCLIFMHNKERLCISLSTMNIADPEIAIEPDSASPSDLAELEATPPDSTRPRIATWTTCKICHAMTEPFLLSAATYSFSFAKWAELIIYHPNFVPHPGLCEHASEDRGALIRCFSMGKTVVSIAVDQIE
jgi:hypothetical protein